MLTTSDWARMAADLEDIRGDHSASIVIRRGATTLAAQTVRIARRGSGGKRDSEGAQESRAGVIVCGATTLDIQVDDRFTTGGVLYRVTLVRPNRSADTQAEAELVE